MHIILFLKYNNFLKKTYKGRKMPKNKASLVGGSGNQITAMGNKFFA